MPEPSDGHVIYTSPVHDDPFWFSGSHLITFLFLNHIWSSSIRFISLIPINEILVQRNDAHAVLLKRKTKHQNHIEMSNRTSLSNSKDVEKQEKTEIFKFLWFYQKKVQNQYCSLKKTNVLLIFCGKQGNNWIEMQA